MCSSQCNIWITEGWIMEILLYLYDQVDNNFFLLLIPTTSDMEIIGVMYN